MKTQHSGAEYANRQDIYKIHVPKTKKDSWKKKKIGKQHKGWKFPPPNPEEEEKIEVEDPIPNENNQTKKEAKT